MAIASQPEHKEMAMMALSQRCSELMPNGKPDFAVIRELPSIRQVIKQIGENGFSDMHKVLQVLVQNFCDSLNVVRNMNENQVFEAASFLIDECEGFRVEDYVMMFTMAKRGQLVKVYDRVDVSVIAQILDAYYEKRAEAGREIQEKEIKAVDNFLNSQTITFAPEIEQVFTDWRQQIETEQKEDAEKIKERQRQVKSYAALHGINLDELQKNFPLKKKK